MTNAEIINAVANASRSGEELVELDADYDLNADGKAVPSGEAGGVLVLGAKGKKIPLSLLEQLGLDHEDEEEETAPDKESKPKRKAVRKKAAEDKAVRPAEDKAEEGVIVHREPEPDREIKLGE